MVMSPFDSIVMVMSPFDFIVMVISPSDFIVMVMSSYDLKILERDDGQQKTNSHYLISPNNSLSLGNICPSIKNVFC